MTKKTHLKTKIQETKKCSHRMATRVSNAFTILSVYRRTCVCLVCVFERSFVFLMAWITLQKDDIDSSLQGILSKEKWGNLYTLLLWHKTAAHYGRTQIKTNFSIWQTNGVGLRTEKKEIKEKKNPWSDAFQLLFFVVFSPGACYIIYVYFFFLLSFVPSIVECDCAVDAPAVLNMLK